MHCNVSEIHHNVSLNLYMQSLWSKKFSFWPIKEPHPTFSIILRISRCCPQRVEVSTRLLVPVMQTHAAELWLPKQSRLRTCKKKTTTCNFHFQWCAFLAWIIISRDIAKRLLRNCEVHIWEVLGDSVSNRNLHFCFEPNFLPISIFSKPSKLRRWYWLTLSASSS